MYSSKVSCQFVWESVFSFMSVMNVVMVRKDTSMVVISQKSRLKSYSTVGFGVPTNEGLMHFVVFV